MTRYSKRAKTITQVCRSKVWCAGLSCFSHGGLLEPTRLLCPWEFSRQEYWSGLPCPPPGDLPNPQIEPRSPALQADSFPSEPPGEPKNIGVGSLSHLQGNFLTQELNHGLLNCRQILYQLSYQGIMFRLFFFSGDRQFDYILFWKINTRLTRNLPKKKRNGRLALLHIETFIKTLLLNETIPFAAT